MLSTEELMGLGGHSKTEQPSCLPRQQSPENIVM